MPEIPLYVFIVVLAGPTVLAALHKSFLGNWRQVKRNIYSSEILIGIDPTCRHVGDKLIVTNMDFRTKFYSSNLWKDKWMYWIGFTIVFLGIAASIFAFCIIIVVIGVGMTELLVIGMIYSLISVVASVLALLFTSYVVAEYTNYHWVVNSKMEHERIST